MQQRPFNLVNFVRRVLFDPDQLFGVINTVI